MNLVKLPEKIEGRWIGLASLRSHRDVCLLLRREFEYSENGAEMFLWISACSFYQLFINGRLVGIGPRAHQNTGTSYIDVHDISLYLENGKNIIAVQVWIDRDPERGDESRFPGMWCQVGSTKQTLLCSDEEWMVYTSSRLTAPRPLRSPGGRHTDWCGQNAVVAGWNEVGELSDPVGWRHPDMFAQITSPGAALELHNTPPAVISQGSLPFIPQKHGKITDTPNWSDIHFPPAAEQNGVWGAFSWLFSEDTAKVKVRIFADCRFKLFCGREAVFAAKGVRGQEVTLPLAAGWNKLSCFALPERSDMGLLMIFPEGEDTFLPRQDTVDTAEPGWCCGGPLRISFDEAGPAVSPDNLSLTVSAPKVENLTDAYDWFQACHTESSTSSVPDVLRTGEFILFKLDIPALGLLNFSVNATKGDRIDFFSGNSLDDCGLCPLAAGGTEQNVLSCICRTGINDLLPECPADCRYVLMLVRKSRRGVQILRSDFSELSRNVTRECFFSCSDPELNRLWRIGRDSLLRTCSLTVPEESYESDDCGLLDSYLDAINVAGVFGDAEYAAVKLRQFASVQLEDGSIPALSCGKKYSSQLIQLFFFPIWMDYNYRFSGNRVELQNLQQVLDKLCAYFSSMLNDKQNFIEPERIFTAPERSSDPLTGSRKITVINALFCRFLLSAEEVYRTLEQTGEAKRCSKLAIAVSKELCRRCFDKDTGLFADSPIAEGTEPVFSMLGNFCAIFSGIKTEECFERFFHTFFDFESTASRTTEAESPYFYFFFQEMLCALRQKEWALRYFRTFWNRKIAPDNGGWLKTAGTKIPVSSGIHGGGALAPNIFLIREILGVRIAEVGHSAIYFSPAYEYLDSAEAVIPTARGRLRIRWTRTEDAGLDITIDSSMPLRVVPELPQEILRSSVFRLSENITLLQPQDF